MWLLHGTTRDRAVRIVQFGPDVDFVEPAGLGIAENFSFTAEGFSSALGSSIEYARAKAAAFSDEGGPAIVAVDVPDDIVLASALEHLSLFDGIIEYDPIGNVDDLVALCGGVVQFDVGSALDSLMTAWGTLPKEIRGVP